MPKERKSPRQKNELECAKDHFSSGSDSARGFRKGWHRKKPGVNRRYRRKSDELLASAKPGLGAQDFETITGEMTAAHLQKSVSRKRLKKIGVTNMGEKIKSRLQHRSETVGRRVRQHEHDEGVANAAVKTLRSLCGEKLVAVVKRAELVWNRNGDELRRLHRSVDPIAIKP